MNKPSLRNAGNARRQRAYRNRKLDDGKAAVNVWLSFDTMLNLKALAAKRRLTLEKAIELAIDESWIEAGMP